MTTAIAPTVEGGPRRSIDVRVAVVAGLWFAAVLLQIGVLSEIRVANGIADLLAAATVLVGARHGSLVGGLAGFGGGLLVELTTPTGTLGVLALGGLVGGSWAGMRAETSAGDPTLFTLLLRTVVVALVSLVVAALVWMLLGHRLALSSWVARVLIPQVGLTALFSLPVLALARRRLWPPKTLVPATLDESEVTAA